MQYSIVFLQMSSVGISVGGEPQFNSLDGAYNPNFRPVLTENIKNWSN